MTGIGFDTLVLAGMGLLALRFVVKAVRHDLGRSERQRLAREARLSH